MAAKAKARRDKAEEEAREKSWAAAREAEPWRYSPDPPEDDTCRVCFSWRPFDKGQEHFGYAWWKVCLEDCDHSHHEGEIWMAAS